MRVKNQTYEHSHGLAEARCEIRDELGPLRKASTTKDTATSRAPARPTLLRHNIA